ncbi:hypothetical protein PQU94_08475 [Asticcacaulis sp. DXS10W]|uniref:Uncharacterized protein n=1 Tax=Asticcacaulis currens TaxID=2984210 RepID=A0ABT5IDS7_9CAUL|nr:hypothetical protein [Asticcacaulis currens]MDC7694314.1 hypothetical protein [Asticcacaulis currens]
MISTDKDLKEPKGGGNEADNANVHVDLKPGWKKRPDQYPQAGEQLGPHDRGEKQDARKGSD